MSEMHRITIDPEVCGGRPCLRGRRIGVTDGLHLLAAGASREEILEDYPYLEPGDIIIAIDGHDVSGIDQLHRLLTEDRIGKDTALTVIRRTEKMEISVTPGESPRRQG